MNSPTDPQSSVQHIRRRLFLLLLRAYIIVVLLTVVLLLVLFGLFVGSNQSLLSPVVELYRIYYLGRGSWEGVETVLNSPGISFLQFELTETILLDEAGRVRVDRGRVDTPLVGQVYVSEANEREVTLEVAGVPVGTVVTRPDLLSGPLRFSARLLGPVAVLSFFPAVLTVLIGLLLTRRVVTPLADVIAAAQSVTAGDLTARVQARGPDDLRGLGDSFNRMAGALERSDRERRNLLADVAHELRTPLSIMRGRLEGIVDGVYPMAEAQIAPVLESTYLLERLVDDLRLLTLAESRQLHFDRRPTDLGELARQAAAVFEAEAAEKAIALRVEAEPGLPTVNADPQRVTQVIGNLVSNALRYAPEGGQITLRVQPAPESVALAVIDNGPGVPETDLPRIFDRFWRGERSRARAAGGAGLGLAIARQLIEAQGGAISASAAPGGGLQITFSLR